MITVGVYTRMSQDDALGSPEHRRRGVRQQLDDSRGLACENGWLVGKVYEDNGISAFRGRGNRPAFEELLRDLADGVIDGVIAYALDRVARQPLDLERLIEVSDLSRHTPIFATCVETIGLTTREDRTEARRLVRGAYQESENVARRVARANKARAETGQARLGGRRPFGWQRDGIRPDPFEARLIRDAYRDLLEHGASISSVRRQWIEAGVTPLATKRSAGEHRQISHRSVRDRLVNPRLCGYRVHLPQSVRQSLGKAPWMPDHVLLDERGEPVAGDWEPVVDAADWRRLTDLLDGRRRQKERVPHSTQPRYFLSGIAQCGLCGRPMHANPYTPDSGPAKRYGYRYQCRMADGGCGGTSRIGPLVERTVESVLLKHLSDTANAARRAIEGYVPAAPSVIEQLRLLENELRHTWGLHSAGEVPTSEFARRRLALATRTAERFVELRTAEARRRARAESLPALCEDWGRLPVAAQRSTLLEWADGVVIHPAGRGKRFDPDLVEVRWHRPADSLP